MLYIIEAGNNDDRMKIINSLNKSDFRQFGNFKNVYYQKIYYDNKKPIGFIVAERHNEKGKLVVDISLAVIPEYRGKGLAYKMAYEAIKKLKKDKNIYKIYWGCEKIIRHQYYQQKNWVLNMITITINIPYIK